MCLSVVLAWGAYHVPRSVGYTMETLPVMLPRSGLYEPEHLPNWDKSYRWSAAQAMLKPANPGGTVILHMVLGGGTSRTTPVRLHHASLILPFIVTPIPRTYTFVLPAIHSERLSLMLESPTMHQKGRALGIMVSNMRLSGGGRVPLSLVVALAVASGAMCLLLKQSNMCESCIWFVLLLQIIVLLWHMLGGWQYAIVGPTLWIFTIATLFAIIVEYAQRTAHRAQRIACNTQRTQSTDHRTQYRTRSLLPLVILALAIRIPWLVAADPVGDLELAARRMWFLYQHGLAGAYVYDGDYMPLRLYILFGLSQIVDLFGGSFHPPLSPVTLLMIKLPGLLADVGIIVTIALWSMRWYKLQHATFIAALYAFAPPTWINVAWWGQVDVLLLFPLIGMVVLLDDAEGRWSWMCWTIALLIKPQAIVFVPLLYIATLRLHGSRGFLVGASRSVILFVLACIPLVLAGQGAGLMQAYLGSVGRFPKLNIGAYNLWYLITMGASGDDETLLFGLLTYRMVGMLLLALAVLPVVVALLLRSDRVMRVEAATVLALSFFLLPTQIHERYLFLVLPFLVFLIACNVQHVWSYMALTTTATLNILGTLNGFVPLLHPLIKESPIPLICAVVNMLLLLGFIVHMFSICVHKYSDLRS